MNVRFFFGLVPDLALHQQECIFAFSGLVALPGLLNVGWTGVTFILALFSATDLGHVNLRVFIFFIAAWNFDRFKYALVVACFELLQTEGRPCR